jgi:hypothetical protein
MKKKSTPQSAFFNLRILIGLCVFITGIFLALLSFGPATSGFAQGTTRAEMALALAQALDIVEPPACVAGAEMFADVPASSPFCPWIEELSRRGITTGCAPGLFCPFTSVTRQQMAVFIVKAMDDVTQSEAFHLVGQPGEPGFFSGWDNFGSGLAEAGFFKDALGIVHLKGTIFGPSDSFAFFLPEGYRNSPTEVLLLPVAGTAVGGGPIAAYLVIDNGGLLPVCASGGSCGFGLDGLSFRVP